MNNVSIAKRLLDHAIALEENGHNLYRIRAYRKAAALVKMLPCPLEEIVRTGGRQALAGLPGVGSHLAVTLEGLVNEGRLRALGPRPEQTDPQERLTSLPGVGAMTALRMTEELGIESANEVGAAAAAGQLSLVGVGEKRLRAIQSVLRDRRAESARGTPAACEPGVEVLLQVDKEFRALVEAQGGQRGAGGGPLVLRTTCGGWNYLASFSPSPLAHRLGQSRDWVVIQFDNRTTVGERIVVTETRPPSAGQRVVRGRERECLACWAS